MTEFLILSAQGLGVDPVVKYTALSLFADRFCASLARSEGSNAIQHWLLQPIRESNLQLFSLVSIWISSKIHLSRPLSVKTLKTWGDRIITEQHFTTRDFFEGEVIFLQMLNFEIGSASDAFMFLEQLHIQFKEVAAVGKLLSFQACTDVMDLLYEKEEMTRLYRSPRPLAASILVCSYLMTVPKQSLEFPILAWVKFAALCEEEEVKEVVKVILGHVFEPTC
ncbi:cyclin-J18 isoform X2 [Syzygium oleosum]|uniref:cyclin-J18 isoform X2 n=1 Tax=Syzygium oleosum TaxID=219896 RepID=UPI0024B9EE9F|nr:cyclin-J18 isoform X2 [Syzygium oleosum]